MISIEILQLGLRKFVFIVFRVVFIVFLMDDDK